MIARDGVLDFDSMQMRLHPAESRVRRLAAEIPAIFIAFDLLLWDGEPVHGRPLEERRAELLRRGEGFWISPATTSLEAATAWLDRFEAAGLDGVIAKRLGLPYMPGSREAVVKVKEHKTADCVVVGVRWKQRPEKLATLLLGLYREDGEVDYVGSAVIGARNHDAIAARVLPLLDERSERRFSEPNRWGNEGLEETPLRHELVAEVRYDKVQGNRFRHGTKLIRFRDDKDPDQCTWREVPRPAPGRPDGGESARAGIDATWPTTRNRTFETSRTRHRSSRCPRRWRRASPAGRSRRDSVSASSRSRRTSDPVRAQASEPGGGLRPRQGQRPRQDRG